MSPAAVFTIDDADRLVLDAADTLFYQRGISGVDMAEIRDASGVSLHASTGCTPPRATSLPRG